MDVGTEFLTRQPFENSQLLAAMQTTHGCLIVFFVSRLKGIHALFWGGNTLGIFPPNP
jgi:hypothetical protein